MSENSPSPNFHANPPKISDTIMELDEYSERSVEQIRTLLFSSQKDDFPLEGSIHQQWFKSVSQGENAIRSWATDHRVFG